MYSATNQCVHLKIVLVTFRQGTPARDDRTVTKVHQVGFVFEGHNSFSFEIATLRIVSELESIIINRTLEIACFI